ncbi:hypothetical protein CF326_g3225 [Tilletia indica]|nr:hypothetical protein CF326_g3225 [Tilletia indica]
MNRASSRTRASGSDSAVGLGISLPRSSPARSPLRRRRSQTESDYNGESSPQDNSASAAASPKPGPSRLGAGKDLAHLAAAASGGAGQASLPQGATGLAPPPPLKRGRGRPRKNPLPAQPPPTGSALASSSTAAPPASAGPQPLSSQASTAEQEKKQAPRTSNGRVTASRNARASAAAQMNRRGLAALEASTSEADALGPGTSETEAEEQEEAEEQNETGSADGEDVMKDEETVQQEAEEMASRWHEEYYEIVEQLPLELTRCFTLISETEGKVQNRLEKTRKASQTYIKARRDVQAWVNYYAAKAQHNDQLAASSSSSNAVAGPSSQTDCVATIESPSRLAKGKGKMDTHADGSSSSSPAEEQGSTSTSKSTLQPSTTLGHPAPQQQQPQGPPPPMPMGLRQRLALLNTVAHSTYEAKRAAEEKVELARTAYELVDRLVLRLDAELTRSEVGLALGLRRGTEESRGAREAHGTLTLAQNDPVASTPATGTEAAGPSRMGGKDLARAENSVPSVRSAAEKRGESKRTGRAGSANVSEGPNGDESARGRMALIRRSSASGSNGRKADRSQTGPSIFAPPPNIAADFIAGSSNRKDKQRASSSSLAMEVGGSSTGPKGSSRSTASSRGGEGSGLESGSGGSKQARRRTDKSKGKSPAVGSKESRAQGGRRGTGLVTASHRGEDGLEGEEGEEAEESEDADAEGEDDNSAYRNTDMAILPAEPRYCYCDEVSRGEMVLCDGGEQCPLQWFHFECVGLTESQKAPTKWFCLFCKPNFKGQGRNVPPNAARRPPGVGPEGLTAAGRGVGGVGNGGPGSGSASGSGSGAGSTRGRS